MSTSFPSARVSFEYFPPRNYSAERALLTAAHALRRFGPDFQTVTFGAGGSDVDVETNWPARLQGLNSVPTAAHIGLSRFSSEADLLSYLRDMVAEGVERLIVLRGDSEGGIMEEASVAEWVRRIKSFHRFDISVACYPEVHPKAKDSGADLDVLLDKQFAGADRAITQFFFDNKLFYRFRDRAERAGFYKEIIPGILPISNIERTCEIAKKCGATVPSSIIEAFEKCGDNNEARSDLARELVEKQVRDLAENGVDAIHIYTLNRIDLAADAARAFQATSRKETAEIVRLAG